MDPSHIIKEAYEKIAAMKKAVGVDPKWLNRTLSHLDNAWSTSHHIVRKGSIADYPEAKSPEQTCICPPGAVDSTCPVHRA